MDILFIEHSSPNYADRTKLNASADITVAFALDFTTAGELCTENVALKQKKLYYPIRLENMLNADNINGLIEVLNSINKKEISINVAGNGIYTISSHYTQVDIDRDLKTFFNNVFTSDKLTKKVILIRSGGQTGVDEAGAKMGQALDIRTIVIAPKGWKFRDRYGRDICDEKLFKQRFN